MAKISKVIYAGETLIDLTGDTVTKEKVLKGITVHGADGELITGTCDFDANTQDATAVASEILANKTAYNKGSKVTGTMKNNGAVVGTISAKAGKYTVPQGYHDGSGTVQIDSTEQAKLIPANIRDGVTILGVEGTMSGTEGVKAQSKTITPSATQQTVLPDSGYNYLSEVTVSSIPYVETNNSAGGKTVTIGGGGGTLISFSIDSKSYQANQGMTWGAWVDSSYNTDNYAVDPIDRVIQPYGSTSTAVYPSQNGSVVTSSDVIISGGQYQVLSY